MNKCIVLCLVTLLITQCIPKTKPIKASPELNNQNNLNSEMNVKQFYQSGDVDWSNAIERALKAAVNSKVNQVYFPPGEYIISRQVNVPKDVNIIGASMNNTIIKALPDGQYKNGIIYFNGGQTIPITSKLSKDIQKYDREIYFQSSVNIQEGDIILVASKNKNSWAGSSNVAGEFIKVQEVINKRLLLFGQTYDNYNRDEVDLYLYKGTQSNIRDLTIIGSPNHLKACIKMRKGFNNNFENILVKGSDYAGIVTTLGYNQSFVNIRSEKTTNDNNHNLSYGINIGNSQNVKLTNCHLYGVRHAVTFGGAGDIQIPNRFNTCTNSTLASRINYAASFHPNSEHCSYINCDILGGVVIRGKNHKVKDCTIYNLYNEEVKNNSHIFSFNGGTLDLNHELTDNKIFIKRKNLECIIYFQDRPNNVFYDGGTMRFSRNRIEVIDDNNSTKYPKIINFTFSQPDDFSTIIMNDNIINSNNAKHTISFRARGSNFHQVIAQNNLLNNVGISVESTNNCILKNNQIANHSQSGIYVYQSPKTSGQNEFVIVESNVIQNCGDMAFQYLGRNQKSETIIVKNNTFLNNSISRVTRKIDCSINNANNCYLQNNIIGNNNSIQSKSASDKPSSIIIQNVNTLHEGNNILVKNTQIKATVKTRKKTN